MIGAVWGLCLLVDLKEFWMQTHTAIPVTVTPEAADRVAELGLQTEFEHMLEHARQTIPGLQRIEVELAPPYDMGDEDRVRIQAFRDPATRTPEDRTWREWIDWEISTFSPDVLRYIGVSIF
jgi:hypothetical protein